MSSKNKKCSGGGVAYKPVSMTHDAQQDVDLYIHGPKSTWSNDSWLGQGRPLELSSLNLSTWTLLTTSIKEHRVGLLENTQRLCSSVIAPLTALCVIAAMLLFSKDHIDEYIIENDSWFAEFFACIITGWFVLICASVMIYIPLEQKCVDETFNPVVQAVLDELAPKLTEDGYKVTLMVESGHSWSCKHCKVFLRFTPLPDR